MIKTYKVKFTSMDGNGKRIAEELSITGTRARIQGNWVRIYNEDLIVFTCPKSALLFSTAKSKKTWFKWSKKTWFKWSKKTWFKW